MNSKPPYTPGMREVLKLAKAEACRLGHETIAPEHYLLAILRKGDGLAIKAMRAMGIDLRELHAATERESDLGRAAKLGLILANAEAERTLTIAGEIAASMRHGWVGTEHLLLALISQEAPVPQRVFGETGMLVTYTEARRAVLRIIENASNAMPGLEQPKKTTKIPDPPPNLPEGTATFMLPSGAEIENVSPELAEALKKSEADPAWAWSGLHRFDLHLLAALREIDSGAAKTLKELGVDPAELAREIDEDVRTSGDGCEALWGEFGGPAAELLGFLEGWRNAAKRVGALSARAAAQLSQQIAAGMSSPLPGTEHLLLAALHSPGVAQRKLEELGIDYAQAEAAALRVSRERES